MIRWREVEGAFVGGRVWRGKAHGCLLLVGITRGRQGRWSALVIRHGRRRLETELQSLRGAKRWAARVAREGALK